MKSSIETWAAKGNTFIASKKFTPVNRRQRKAQEKEILKIGRILSDTEARFLNQLFDENDTSSYKELYDFYLAQYQRNIKACALNYNPKTVFINSYYFMDTYKAVEGC
jgi:hypothetical protein